MKQKQFYYCHLYTCNNPGFLKFKPNENEKDKIIYATDIGHRKKTDTLLIVVRNSNCISRYGYNYGTEIITGIQIPILGEVGRELVGRVKEPYCGKVDIDKWPYNEKNGKGLFPKILEDSPDAKQIKEYLEEHKGEDGSYTAFQKKIIGLIEKSTENYKKIEIEEPEIIAEPVKEETSQEVYDNYVRARKNNPIFFYK